MPEHAEVHRSGHVVRAHAQRRKFSAAYEVRGSCRRVLEGTEDWNPSAGFGVTAFSRGKELALVLLQNRALGPAQCTTCSAIAGRLQYTNEPRPCPSGLSPNSVGQSDDSLALNLRFGMHGGVDVVDAHGNGRRRGSSIYIELTRNDGLTLYICAWHSDGLFDPQRSPDPLAEHDAWRSTLADRTYRAYAYKVPLCEALLDQSLVNGSGNYVRAECLYHAGLKPFDPLSVLQEEKNFTRLCCAMRNVLIRAALEKLRGFNGKQMRNWRVVYGKRDAKTKREVDALGRTIFFQGQLGTLPSSIVEHKPNPSIFIGNIPRSYSRQGLKDAMQVYGSGARRCILNFVRRFAIVRFYDVESASEALRDVKENGLAGRRVFAEFQRSVRKPQREANPAPVADPDLARKADGSEEGADAEQVEERGESDSDEELCNVEDDAQERTSERGKKRARVEGEHEEGDADDEDDEWEDVGKVTEQCTAQAEAEHKDEREEKAGTESEAGAVLLERTEGSAEGVGTRAALASASAQELAEALRGSRGR